MLLRSPTFFAIALLMGCASTSAEPPPETQSGEQQKPAVATDTDGAGESDEALESDEELEPDEKTEPYAGSPYERAPYDREYDASELFEAVCADCHGEAGDGDAPIEAPFSFATPAQEWTNGPTVDGILITLEDGIHDTAMREFPEYKNVDREKLADYILELRYALLGQD